MNDVTPASSAAASSSQYFFGLNRKEAIALFKFRWKQLRNLREDLKEEMHAKAQREARTVILMALEGNDRIPRDLADLVLEKLKRNMNKYEFTDAEKRLVRDSTTASSSSSQHHLLQ